MKILFPSFLSFVIGLISALFISKFGFKMGLADIPSERSAHDKPTPKGGGIGIPIAVCLITLLFYKSGFFFVSLPFILSIFAFINDKTEIPTILRLIIELALGSIFVFLFKKEFFVMLQNKYGPIIILFTMLFFTIYIVAATNFFNFMDGINGIAGFEASISFGFIGIYVLFFRKTPEISIIPFSVVAASVGFLLFNFPKAKVFMGDVGSIFIGFLFAGMAVYLTSNIKEFLLLTLFQSIFYIDCISTIFLRILKGENILVAHKKHLYQKLVHQTGWTHPKVTLYFGFIQILIGISALQIFRLDTVLLVIFWCILLMIYWSILVGFKLIRAENRIQ